MSDWDKEGINERMREVLSSGYSFAHVARVLNEEFGTTFTRSAIIGRAHRNGVYVKLDGRKKQGRPPRPRGTDGAMARAIIGKSVRQEPEPLPEPPIDDNDIPIEQRKTLLELTSQTCRWPVGEGADLFFCGALPMPHQPYCGPHCKRAFGRPNHISEDERERRHFHGLRVTKLRHLAEPIVSAPTRTSEAA